MNESVNRNHSVGSFRAWGLPPVDFDEFHRVEARSRLDDGVEATIAWDLVDVPPLAITLPDGRAYSYVSAAGGVVIEPGISQDAAVVLEMDEQAWQDYVYEFRNPPSLVLAESVLFQRGGLAEWDAWKPALRCLYSGKPIYDPAAPLLDRAGRPLDLHRSFTLDDDPEEMSHFLRTASFLVVREVFSGRVAEIADEVERLRAAAKEGELWSWWGRDDAGRSFPYRLVYMAENSALIRALGDSDPTVRRLVELAGLPLVPLHDRGQGDLTVLKSFSPDTKVFGLAPNIPWHMDCELGGCPVMCPSINIGIQLDAANADSSQLWVLPGSQGTAPHSFLPDDVPAVALETEPGDATIHYSCALHAAPQPTGSNGRRTVYLPFYGEKTLQLLGRFESFEQVIPAYGTGAMPNLFDVEETLR